MSSRVWHHLRAAPSVNWTITRSRLIVVLALFVLAGATGTASAHDTSFASTVELIDASGDPSDAVVFGTVSSPRPECERARTVRLFSVELGDTVLVDIARTSNAGAWAGKGDFSDAVEIRATVTKKNIGPPGHRHVCRSDSDTEAA